MVRLGVIEGATRSRGGTAEWHRGRGGIAGRDPGRGGITRPQRRCNEVRDPPARQGQTQIPPRIPSVIPARRRRTDAAGRNLRRARWRARRPLYR